MTTDGTGRATLTADDKIWAAIAHASVLVSFWGPLVPVILWFLQRRKSAHVRFHALQALAYQITSFWAGLILLPVLFILMFIVMIVLIASTQGGAMNDEAGAAFAIVLPLLIWLPILGAFAAYILLGFLGALSSLTGREFRYPFIGGRLQRKLGYDPAADASISEEHEDQVVAAVSHATAIIPMFGVVVPLIVWVTQKDRGAFLRFQSLQAVVYQGLGTVAYFAITGVYMFAMFATMGVLSFGAAGGEQPSAGFVIAFLLTVLPLACVALVFLIGGPLYHLFGFIASLKTLRGNDYNYPLLGRFLRKRMQPAEPAREAAA